MGEKITVTKHGIETLLEVAEGFKELETWRPVIAALCRQALAKKVYGIGPRPKKRKKKKTPTPARSE